MASGLFTGEVVHVRRRPKQHRLRYRVFSLLLDLDELDILDRKLKFFAHNRFALFSFHDADHGDLSGQGPRAWVDAQLSDAGHDPARYRVELLCYPRILGYVFNPLSVYFCFDENDEAALILYEVCNTFGERHTYVIPAEAENGIARHSCAKQMYVSPFTPMDCTYRFKIMPPRDRVLVAINEADQEGDFLYASFAGRRQPLTDKSLLSAFWRYPLMTLKVSAAIHWEAFLLLSKGLRVFRHKRAETRVAVSIEGVKNKSTSPPRITETGSSAALARGKTH